MTASLVIGASGFIGGSLVGALPGLGIEAAGSSRREGRATLRVADGAALDAIVGQFDQIVVTAQLTADGVDWLLARVDGPRWLVFSSAQVTSSFPAAGTDLALARESVVLSRGGTVLRPTMVFGQGRDRNVSRLIRNRRRWRIPFQVGDGRRLVQPLHVDDLVSLVACHARAPAPGLYEVGGDEAVPASEILLMIDELLALRMPPLSIPVGCMGLMGLMLRAAGFRADQVRRLQEDKTVDVMLASKTFDWWPSPLAIRLEQAVRETIGP